MSAPDIAQASNTLLNEVTTKLSCRPVPGQDPDDAFAALQAHLDPGQFGPGRVTDPSSAAHQAAAVAFDAGYGHEVAARM